MEALVASRIDRFPVANMKSGWISAQTCVTFSIQAFRSQHEMSIRLKQILISEMFLWWLTDGSVASAFVGPLLLPSLPLRQLLASSLHFAPRAVVEVGAWVADV